MKKKLIIILALMLLAGGYVYASYNSLLPENLPKVSAEKINELKTKTPDINSLEGDAKIQLETFSSKAQDLGNIAKNALNTGIQVDDSQPAHEKVIEYGQYVYCKQVVETYENNQSLNQINSN